MALASSVDESRGSACLVRGTCLCCTKLPLTSFIHRAHVRVSLVCLQRYDLVASTHSQDLPSLLAALEVAV